MNLDDINLEHIKVVVFDFDDTLAIHKDKNFSVRRRVSEDRYIAFYKNAYTCPETFYDEIEPCIRNEKLYAFINTLRALNIKMYCLSGMKLSFHLKAKQAFIDKYYGNDIEVLSAGTQELKLMGVKIIKAINNCQLNEILFIDDKQDVVDLLKQNNIQTLKI